MNISETQRQRMDAARDMLIRRRKDAESLGGSAEIATEELDEAIAALTRPEAELAKPPLSPWWNSKERWEKEVGRKL